MRVEPIFWALWPQNHRRCWSGDVCFIPWCWCYGGFLKWLNYNWAWLGRREKCDSISLWLGCSPRRKGSWLPVHLIFYCLMLKEKLCSMLFPACIQRYTGLPPQPFYPAFLPAWKSRSIASLAGYWFAQCWPFLSLRGWREASAHHEPLHSPREVQFKFCIILLNQGWLVSNCGNLSTR